MVTWTQLATIESEFFKYLDQVENLKLVEKLGLRPPTIVAIGSESAGKSSVLERLIGIPILPRDKGLCTRMAIRVELRRGAPVPAVVSVRERNAADRKSLRSLTVAVEDMCKVILKMMMEEVATAQCPIVMGREIVVEIRDKHIPELTIIDLPGFVATDQHGQGIRELTERLAAKVIDEEGDNATYLLVADATSPVNLSLGMAVVEKNKLQARTLGVLTKLDIVRSADPDISNAKAIALKLLCEEPGSIRLQASKTVPAGWVGCANRPPKSDLLKNTPAKEVDTQRLILTNAEEANCITEWNPSLSVAVKSLIGIDNVRERVKVYFEAFLVKTWFPKLFAAMHTHAQQLTTANQHLGQPMPPIPQYIEQSRTLAKVLPSTEYTAEDGKTKKRLPLVNGWTPATKDNIRQLLLRRVNATAAREDKDWLEFSNVAAVWKFVTKLREYPAKMNAEWAAIATGLTMDAGKKLADAQLQQFCRVATGLTEALQKLASDNGASKLHSAVVYTPQTLSKWEADSPTFFQSATFLAMPYDEQASITRMSRLQNLGVQFFSLADDAFKIGANNFAAKATALITSVQRCVNLKYERSTDGNGVTRCRPHYVETLATFGDELIELFDREALQPTLTKVETLVVADSVLEESMSNERLQLLSDAVTTAKVMEGWLKLQKKLSQNSA